MKNVASFLIDNKAKFAFGANDKQAELRVIALNPDLAGDLIALAKKQGLSVALQGGITIFQGFPAAGEKKNG